MKASKVIDNINLKIKDKEYNLADVIINSNNFNSSEFKFDLYTHNLFYIQLVPKMFNALKRNKRNNLLDKLYILCIGSNLTQIV